MSDDFELLRDSFRRDLRLRDKADRTIGAYVESVDRFTAWARAQGLTSVTQITRAHVRSWLEELLDTVSAQTTVRHHSGAKQWFKWLLAEEEIESNPFDGVPQPAV
ncbi:MAG TPA: phage integrase N-terminal SAM-like domain-containing protein, partial [Jiangellaceae bacterium]